MRISGRWKTALLLAAGFLAAYHLPLQDPRFRGAVLEGLFLLKDYARQHVVLCLVPAFFIAGAISVLLSKGAVLRFLGASARRLVAYSVASVSGSVLSVCSCTVLPIFAGIYGMGAGLGPATTFLYSGPAINVLAIILTGRVLGMELGVARTLGAVLFGIVLGLLMSFFFRGEERKRCAARPSSEPLGNTPEAPVWHSVLLLLVLVLILVTATWGGCECSGGLTGSFYRAKGLVLSGLGLILAAMLHRWLGARLWKLALGAAMVAATALLLPGRTVLSFGTGALVLSWILASTRGEGYEWFDSTFGFTRQVLPLLFLGVLAAGVLLGRPGQQGVIPSSWIESAVGGNSVTANLAASLAGALMYFATLTEVPIVQGLMGAGMGKGPALALLLAGPAVSLPNLLVIRSVLGTRKTVVFAGLVVTMATLCGSLYGWLLAGSGG
ncbi:permease [Candidatus Fermentibacterales bacterium]|nr:permease [Candidatus Fermentibacterales bacterium]